MKYTLSKHKHKICLRGSVPTTYVLAPHLEEISTITIRFGSWNFYTLGLQAYRKTLTQQTLCNHTLHTKCRNLARVLLLKCSDATSPQVRQPTPLLLDSTPSLASHFSRCTSVLQVILTIKGKYSDLFSKNNENTNEAHTH